MFADAKWAADKCKGAATNIPFLKIVSQADERSRLLPHLRQGVEIRSLLVV